MRELIAWARSADMVLVVVGLVLAGLVGGVLVRWLAHWIDSDWE